MEIPQNPNLPVWPTKNPTQRVPLDQAIANPSLVRRPVTPLPTN